MKIDQIIIKDNKIDLIIRYSDMFPHRCNSITFYISAKTNKVIKDNVEYDQITNTEDVDKGFRTMLNESYCNWRLGEMVEEVNKFLSTPPYLDE